MKKTLKTPNPNYCIWMLLLCATSLLGQEGRKSTALKLYTNFGITTTKETLSHNIFNMTSIEENNTEIQIGHLSPSIALTLANGDFHEFELSRFIIGDKANEVYFVTFPGQSIYIISGERKTNVSIALRYEYDVVFFKNSHEAKLCTYLGFAAQPYFSNSTFTPKILRAYSTSQSNFGAMISIVPRLNYDLNERWFIDFNIPINIVDMNWVVQQVDNPTLPENLRTATTFEPSAFPTKFLFRLGVGIRI